MKVLITRPRTRSQAFAESLKAAGFAPIFFPVIEIRPITDNPPLDQALKNLDRYSWVVFTSVNGVEAFFNKLSSSYRRGLGEGVKVAAIGPKTAEALCARGVNPDFIPNEYVAEAILPGLGNLRGRWVLLPRAEIARKALPEAIQAAGGVAHEISVYKTLPAEPDADGLAALKSGVDFLTFTSPSTVCNFVEIVQQQGLDPFHLPGAPKIACIGPITATAAREQGFEVAVVAQEYTTEGLIRAISGQPV